MPVPIEAGDSFYCQAFAGISMRDLPEPIEIAPRLWASKGLPVQAGEHWEKWLGELAFRSLSSALVITATAHTPGLIINSQLKQEIDLLMIGLVLHTAPTSRESFLIAGANESGHPEPRQFGRAGALYSSWQMQPLIVGRPELERTVDLATKLKTINYEGEDWRRIRRAIDALTKGFAEPKYQDSRLRAFVRCLEGLIRPEQGRSRTQFVHRAQTFATANEAARLALSEIYEIRSRVEHLHLPTDPLPGSTLQEKEALLFRRVRQVDTLARFTMCHVLDNPALISAFKNDDTTAAFWHLPENVRVTLWGTGRLDLDSIA